MNCQMVGCRNQAIGWSLYKKVPGYAMCTPCAENSKRFAEKPEDFELKDLNGETEILLKQINHAA